MDWRLRAWLLQKMAAWPGGYSVYQFLQRFFGLHCKSEYIFAKLTMQRDLARHILESGGTLSGARVVEVGTGWVPLAPLGFWICGAAAVHTVDIHRHFIPSVLRKALGWMGANEERLVELWKDLASAERVRECLRIIREKSAQPLELLEAARIAYLAPADATKTGLSGASLDIHYSLSVLEHVPLDTIRAILREARRLLKPGGRCGHFVDPTDHFALFDHTITNINFLRYTDVQWQDHAGSALAYHNRLRDGDFEKLFHEAGFQLLKHAFTVDSRAYEALQQGFPVAAPFRAMDCEQICRRDLVFVGTAAGDVS